MPGFCLFLLSENASPAPEASTWRTDKTAKGMWSAVSFIETKSNAMIGDFSAVISLKFRLDLWRFFTAIKVCQVNFIL